MEVATVLVVESDILVRQPIAAYLRDCGYRVLEAVNGTEAREYLAGGRHAVDVALIGVKSVPTESGFALASWVRLKHPRVKVLLGGTVANVLQLAGELCDESPHGSLDYRAVLDHIRRLLATREPGSSDKESKP
jgi:CheY-like chemotaxis protein